MIELREAGREQQRRDPGSVEIFFSNHPSPKDRIDLLARLFPRRRSGQRDSADFHSIRARLGTLPPARSMTRQ